MIKVGIVGGTGYTGVELLRLLARHPQVELKAITSRKEAGMPVAEMFPNLRGRVKLAFSTPEEAGLEACDVVFFATPNGVAMQQTRALLDAGVKVIDLAADFRIKDIAVWEKWYKMEHACPDLVAEAVYGLPEINRDKIKGARLIANPGCYPTAVQLGFLPLLESGAVDTGFSGGGRQVGRVRRRAQAGNPYPVRRGGGQLQGLCRRRSSPLAGDQAGTGQLRRQAGGLHLRAAPDAADPRHPRDPVREGER